MTDVRFVFLHCGELDATVIDSQVVDTIAAAAEHGVRFDLVVLLHGGAWIRRRAFHARRRAEVAQRIPGRVRTYVSPAKETPHGDALATALVVLDALRGRARRTVVHARGDMSAWYASRAKRLVPSLRYVYDVRGDSRAELEHLATATGLPAADRERARSAVDRRCAGAAGGAEHLFCVSTVLRDRMCARYGVTQERVTVVPGAADPEKFRLDEAERAATRRALGLEDRFVVAYPGRFGAWHLGPEMARLVAALVAKDPSVFFLVLTPDVAEARALLTAALPAGSFDVRAAAHAEVAKHLRAADLGLLLRAHDPLNEVACPTKFAEYLLCGLPVLISAGIGDCSRFVTDHRAGVAIEAPTADLAQGLLAELRREPGAARRARIAALAEPLSRRRAAREMAGVYLRLAGA